MQVKKMFRKKNFPKLIRFDARLLIKLVRVHKNVVCRMHFLLIVRQFQVQIVYSMVFFLDEISEVFPILRPKILSQNFYPYSWNIQSHDNDSCNIYKYCKGHLHQVFIKGFKYVFGSHQITAHSKYVDQKNGSKYCHRNQQSKQEVQYHFRFCI